MELLHQTIPAKKCGNILNANFNNCIRFLFCVTTFFVYQHNIAVYCILTREHLQSNHECIGYCDSHIDQKYCNIFYRTGFVEMFMSSNSDRQVTFL